MIQVNIALFIFASRTDAKESFYLFFSGGHCHEHTVVHIIRRTAMFFLLYVQIYFPCRVH